MPLHPQVDLLLNFWEKEGRKVDLQKPETLKGIYAIDTVAKKETVSRELSDIASDYMKQIPSGGYRNSLMIQTFDAFLYHQIKEGRLYKLEGKDKTPKFYSSDHSKGDVYNEILPISKTDQVYITSQLKSPPPWYTRSKTALWFGTLFKSKAVKKERTRAYEEQQIAWLDEKAEKDQIQKVVMEQIEKVKEEELKAIPTHVYEPEDVAGKEVGVDVQNAALKPLEFTDIELQTGFVSAKLRLVATDMDSPFHPEGAVNEKGRQIAIPSFKENPKINPPSEVIGYTPNATVSGELNASRLNQQHLGTINLACMISSQYVSNTATNKLMTAHQNNICAIPQALARYAWRGDENPEITSIHEAAKNDGAKLTAAAIKAYNSGDPKPLGAHLGKCVNTLTTLLRGTSPEEFRDATSENAVVVQMLKNTFTILDKNPALAQCSGLTEEQANCARGWTRFGESIKSQNTFLLNLNVQTGMHPDKTLTEIGKTNSNFKNQWANYHNHLVVTDYLAASQDNILKESKVLSDVYNPETERFNNPPQTIWQHGMRKMKLSAIGMDNPLMVEYGKKPATSYHDFLTDNVNTPAKEAYIEKTLSVVKEHLLDCSGLCKQAQQALPEKGNLATALTDSLEKNKNFYREHLHKNFLKVPSVKINAPTKAVEQSAPAKKQVDPTLSNR